ncbi:uncharacterized protein LOC107048552 [Diachasma alloeum]|uniref:uncharacterized protein LOC107048552 n=1 Tax=Diachasma alloeum TaxID=454923 RepID=UPI0007383906|nr:uncharacterized protein LOC107048552 [Diachasma alloeum]XP_015127258.1 uncharacterized protein LOC107048552 [Diachasma alloeum]
MSVIIRLQNLAWSANALDIRQFFRGLSIPEGGVHIVGGELGDAFIAFSTDEDARQAMMHDGGKIKEMKIKLLLSSRTEMQKVIEAARQQTLSLQSFMQTPVAPVPQQSGVPLANSQQLQQKSSPAVESKRDKERDNESETTKDRKDRRDRSRSRDRSKSRDRDRDRDRRDRGRDRRRRDRSRSRDRDRRDRGRRRRDRSRDRTRSRDRDSKRSSHSDRRKDIQDDDNSEVVIVGSFPKDQQSGSKGSGKKGNASGGNSIENGIWEVPPQSQMPLIIAPGILGAGIAALPETERSMNFPTVGQTPLMQPNQFQTLNGINGGIQTPAINSLNLNSLPSSLGLSSINSLKRDNQWSSDRPPRLSDIRFPVRSTGFDNFPSFGNTNFRANSRANSHLLSKMQELDGRRNPHAFQTSSSTPYDAFPGNSERAKSRNVGNGVRFDKSGGHCIEVRNMPLNATYGDVRHAFQGIYIRKDGLKLINDTQGNRVGIAYIRFLKPEGKELALSVPRFIRGSEVEVCSLDETLFDKAVDSYVPEREKPDENPESITNDSRNSCILLADLPSFTKEADIAKELDECKINDLFITSKKDSSGTPQYMAYVQFSRAEDAKAALTSPLKIGPKAITAMSISDDKFSQAKRTHEQETLGEASTPDCIIMRGLPFQVIERDIQDFFSDIGIVPRRIHMMLNNHGSPAGECFCEFESAEEAVRATGKSGLPMGKNFPTIELVARNKMLDMLGNADTQFVETQQPFPLPLQERPRFSPMGNHPPRFGNGGFGLPRGPPGIMALPRHMPINRPGPPGSSLDYVEGFGKPGCVLSLENVPFKADINEIIEFFRDFDVKRENVIRRYNEKGMPTGDARVAFSSPNEAQRALRELRHCKVRDRTIYLKLA